MNPHVAPSKLRLRPLVAAVALAAVADRPARVAVFENPFSIEVGQKDFSLVPAMATIASLAPKTSQPFTCSIDGVYIGREEWETFVRPGEIVIFQILPLGGKGGGSNPLRAILQIALMVGVAFLVGPAMLGLTGMTASLTSAGLMILGSMLINALVPLPKSGGSDGAGASPTYSIALQGNSARLDQPKPVGYGQQKSYPDFAMQPYSEFVNNEQVYKAVLCIGMGRYDIQKIEIDDTPIINFGDVVMDIVGPGRGSVATQALIDTQMISCPEVSGQEIKDISAWIGPFTVCKPGLKVSKLYCDVVAPRGAGYAKDDGALESRTLEFQVQGQEVDDAGVPVGAWFDLRDPTNANYKVTGATVSAIQISCEYVFPDVKRYQVRMRRASPYVDSTREMSELTWASMRAKSTQPGIVEKADPESTYVFLSIRASKQLSGMSQRKIAAFWERKIPLWNGSAWVWLGASAHHRNPAWVLADILRNNVYSLGLQDSRIDMASLVDLAAACEARQDRFDYIYDTLTTVWEALALAARAARAVPLVRNGNYTFVRDSAQSLPVAMYQPRNMSKESLSIDLAMPQENTPDAVRVKFRDGRVWDERTVIGQYFGGQVYAYIEGVRPAGVPAPYRYADVPFPGISGLNHALREAAYIVAASRFRRKTYTWTSDLEALIPAYGSLVAMSHDLPGFGQNADVFTYDAATRTLTTSQPLTWTAGAQHHVRLGNRAGGLTSVIEVTRGASDDVMTLATAPGFAVVEYDDADLDPTKILFGPGEAVCAMLRVKSIRQRGENSIEMIGIVEDDRVHTCDNAYLPAGGAAQDVYTYGALQPAVMPSASALM